MRVGRDVDGGFEILNDQGDVVGAVYPDEQSGRVDVTPGGSYSGLDPLPTITQELQAFAEEEVRRRKAATGQG